MENNVIVSIVGNQLMPDGQEGKMELVTEGSFYRDDQSYVLEYQESELSGMKGTTTRIRLRGQSMSLERHGTYNAHFVFEKWKTYRGQYITPFGEINMELFATDFGADVDSEALKGKVDVEYEMQVGGMRTSNQLLVSFRSKGLPV
ncbi:MAG: DUF1934 domain-containing protein [Christensenellales bacterium]|jgi:uncharacterized beta-barrel protein YwiB (DUF1934 family)|nr:DUF1934 domain-containing protein [Clostridiales bacterium]